MSHSLVYPPTIIHEYDQIDLQSELDINDFQKMNAAVKLVGDLKSSMLIILLDLDEVCICFWSILF